MAPEQMIDDDRHRVFLCIHFCAFECTWRNIYFSKHSTEVITAHTNPQLNHYELLSLL